MNPDIALQDGRPTVTRHRRVRAMSVVLQDKSCAERADLETWVQTQRRTGKDPSCPTNVVFGCLFPCVVCLFSQRSWTLAPPLWITSGFARRTRTGRNGMKFHRRQPVAKTVCSIFASVKFE